MHKNTNMPDIGSLICEILHVKVSEIREIIHVKVYKFERAKLRLPSKPLPALLVSKIFYMYIL